MPNCNIIGCGFKRSRNHPNVTLHQLPANKVKKKIWLERIGVENLKMSTKNIHICSLHFEESCFNRTLNKVTLRDDALPSQTLLGNSSIPAVSRVCKLCLGLDLKMYKLEENSLAKMYEDVIGMAPRTDPHNRLPMGICWECTARLQSAAAFRSKALFSDELLQEHLKNNAELNIIDIQNLHREHTILKPKIEVQEVFNFSIHNVEEHTLENSKVTGIRHNEEFEIEVQDLVSDKITIKDERQNESLEEVTTITDAKIEIDLIPITEFDDNDRDTKFDDNDEDTKFDVNDKESEFNNSDRDTEFDEFSEDYCSEVKDVDISENKVSLDNIILFKSEGMGNEEINLSSNINLVQSDKNMDADDDDNVMHLNEEVSNINDNDDDVDNSTKVAVKKVVPQKKKRDVKKKKVAVKNKVKTDDDVIVGVKGKRPQKPTINVNRKPIDENVFTIKSLNHDDLRKEILARKDGNKYLLAPFKCDVCFKGFPTEDTQARHIIKHSEQSGAIKCTICYKRMTKARYLRTHMTSQHTSEFICKLCPMVTRNRNVALRHMKDHEGKKYECPHPGCFREFDKYTSYMGHVRIKHPSDFVCGLCGYSFVNAKGIEQHKKLKHRLDNVQIPEDGPLCELCNVRFISSEVLKQHIRVSARHKTDRKRKPRQPNKKRQARDKDANSDEKRQKTEEPIPCEQCGLQLGNWRAYHVHFRRMHPDKNRTNYPSMKYPFMCEICGRMSASYTELEVHKWVHTGENPFKCESCGKAFRVKSRLDAHSRIHSEVRETFECKICGKHFTNYSNRQRHMFIHTGLKPFKCEMCGKSFKNMTDKRAHITYVHLKKPWPKRSRGKRRPDTRQDQLASQDQDMDTQDPISPCDLEIEEVDSMNEDNPVYIFEVGK